MRRTRLAEPDDGYFGFYQQSQQLYRRVVKSRSCAGYLCAGVLHLACTWQMPPERLIDGPVRRVEPISLRTPLALLLISLGAIAAVWWWLATPITLARAPIDPNAKLLCVSYAPFRGAQTPLDLTTRIPAEQIAQDLAQLAKISECVRTYSIENGLDQVPALAAKVGLKVMQGIWLGSDRLQNAVQISTVIGLTKAY